MNERFKSLALENGLMGLGNHLAMELELENVHAGAMRFHRTYSVAIFDIDHFKLYNDHCGQQAGDDRSRSSWTTVVGEADKALYLAKGRGRNRMMLWRPSEK